MTWVIGRAGPFGYAVGLSDIRVTLSDGNEVDCLQKIHAICPSMALGFAGSVAIGFKVIEQLSAELQSVGRIIGWNPLLVAGSVPQGTRILFNSFSPEERALGCELMLLSAHPTEQDGDAPWARCYVFRFRAPDFEPVIARPASIVTIGSGRLVSSYIGALRNLEKDFTLFNLETGMPGGSAFGLMMSVTSAIKRTPTRGISTHLHICIVGRDGVRLGKNNTERPDNPDENFTMPPVASNMEELKQILGRADVSLAKCQAASKIEQQSIFQR